MALYIMPVQQVLLEYVLKLGKVIFFPSSTQNEDILISKLSNDEKDILFHIIDCNKEFFDKSNCSAYIMIESDYDVKMLVDDITLVEKVFAAAEKAFDYVKILECSFGRPEYYIGIAGLANNKRYLISVDENYHLSFYINGKEYYYLMQKGIGEEIFSREEIDLELYSILFSNRTDEVYCFYRQLISEACEALNICDESRCFVYLFSKVDGMGLCDSFHFTNNKKRILSVISSSQNNFDARSSQLYFYSKSIRTEVVHKGRKITEFVSLEEAQKINQTLFKTIIEFCRAIILTNITSISQLKTYLTHCENSFTYNTPTASALVKIENDSVPKTTYMAFVEGLEVGIPSKRGNFYLLPSLSEYAYKHYADNYLAMELDKPVDSVFDSFSQSDLEYITDCIYRFNGNEPRKYAMIIGLNMPNLLEKDIDSPLKRERVVDYICNEMNIVLYYDILCGGEYINGRILPPRVGIENQIRAIYEYVEYEEDLYIRPVPGRVFGQYCIPEIPYKCMCTNLDEQYDILFNTNSEIKRVFRDVLINVCEVEYMADMTQKVSYLYDIFDSLEPRTYNGDKAIKYVFTYLATDKTDYLSKRQEFESKRERFRNPILHAGKNIFDIESNEKEIQSLLVYLTKIITDYCYLVTNSNISTFDQLDNEYHNHQIRLGIR